MKFSGLTKQEFESKYAKGVSAALASITQQPESAVSLVAMREGGAPAAAATGRKLLDAQKDVSARPGGLSEGQPRQQA
jgi:hypothetical protein